MIIVVEFKGSVTVQGISMLMGGLAKLDAQPGEELLDLASASLHTGLKEYGHQAVANSFYSLAKLQHYDAELCAAVDQHVSQSLSDHRPQVCFLLANNAQPPRSSFDGHTLISAGNARIMAVR